MARRTGQPFGAGRIDRLLDAGLPLGDHPEHETLRTREELCRAEQLVGPAALAQVWPLASTSLPTPTRRYRSELVMFADHGPPPPEAL
jgi:hypothetical protein